MAAPDFNSRAHLDKITQLEAQDYVPPNYPTSAHTHKQRHNLELVEQGDGKAVGTFSDEKICMICNGTQGELFDCDGQMNGEMKDGEVMGMEERPFRACKSQFHLECIKAYNASNLDFHYAARVECQRKFLCPLHCCSVCNTEHKKQSAYESVLIECVQCFRAFHVGCCYPAGSKLVEVTIDLEEEPATFEMLTCPSHCRDARSLHHIPACCKTSCAADGELQECRTCMRSFHPECKEVEMLNGVHAPEDQCDVCACNDVIVVGTPIIAFCPSMKEYHMGLVHKATQHGAVMVEWLKNGESTSTYEIGLSHVAEVQESYLHLAPGNQMSYWEGTFEKWMDSHLARHPTVFKKVFREVTTSIRAPRNRKNVPQKKVEIGCGCRKTEDCDSRCGNAVDGNECPPDCVQNKAAGASCYNRKISDDYIHPHIELKEAGKKGWGIFAKARIEEGAFLAAFHGEMCDKQEFRRRMAVKIGSKDKQYIYQFLDLENGFMLDMSTHGNISRYANNSCDNPNAIMCLKKVFAREDRNAVYYENRCILEASKTIEKDEEVTITYGGNNNDGSPCFCDSCLKKMEDEPQWDEDAMDVQD